MKGLNFLIQSTDSNQFIKFRHQYLINLAKQFGATFKNFTPDSCDMIFPNKESMEAFEKARNEYVIQLIENQKYKE